MPRQLRLCDALGELTCSHKTDRHSTFSLTYLSKGERQMLWQCACCGGKIDDQEDDHEAMEVKHEYGRVWYYYHPLCIDTLRTIERKLKELGTPEKSSLPKKVVGIRGSWSGQPLHST